MHPLIAKALAKPHTHEVVTVYADGAERKFTTRSRGTAESFADRERSKIGRDLISREGGTVRVTDVIVRELAA